MYQKKCTTFVLILSVSLLMLAACATTEEAQPMDEVAAESIETALPTAIVPPTNPPEPTATLMPTQAPLSYNFSKTAHFLSNLQGGGPVLSIAWHPDSSLFAMSGLEQILVWSMKDLTHAYELPGHNDIIIGVAWSPNGSQFASLSLDNTVRLWDTTDYQTTYTLDTPDALCMGWSPDSTALLVGTQQGDIQVWDPQTGTLQTTWQSADAQPIYKLQFSPNGTLLAARLESGEVAIRDAQSGDVLRTLADDQGSRANDLAWSPDENYLATAHQNGLVHLWDTASWTVERSIEALDSGVSKIAWTPDSRVLATGGEPPSVPLLDVKTGQRVTGLGFDAAMVWSLAWSPNGKFVAFGSSGKVEAQVGGMQAGPSFHWGFEDTEHFSSNPDAGLVYLWIRH